MSDNYVNVFFIGAAVGVILMLALFMFGGITISKDMAVKHGCAHYNSETAAFEWDDSK